MSSPAFEVTVLEAREILIAESRVVLRYAKTKYCTSTQLGDRPRWDESFPFQVVEGRRHLTLELIDSSRAVVGSFKLRVPSDLITEPKWWALTPSREGVESRAALRLKVVRKEESSSGSRLAVPLGNSVSGSASPLRSPRSPHSPRTPHSPHTPRSPLASRGSKDKEKDKREKKSERKSDKKHNKDREKEKREKKESSRGSKKRHHKDKTKPGSSSMSPATAHALPSAPAAAVSVSAPANLNASANNTTANGNASSSVVALSCGEDGCTCQRYTEETNGTETFCVCGHEPSVHRAVAPAGASPQLVRLTSPSLDLAALKKTFSEGGALEAGPSWELDAKELAFQSVLGEGTSAKVFAGLYRNQEVAIKVLKDKIELKQLEDFRREFEMMSMVRSPHVVFFYGATVQPLLCMVLERCHRGSFFDAMNSRDENDVAAFTWPRALKMIESALKGILCLHSWKPQIVHRDLKSLNLLVDDNYNVKVGDFGLSRYTSGTGLSTLGKLRGTFAYCAPEVYFGTAFSPASDIYAMGIIVWEVAVRIIKGQYAQPYSEYKQFIFPFQIIIQTAKQDLRPTIPPSTPPELAAMISSAWHKDPDARPTAQAMLDQLRQLQGLYTSSKETWEKAIVGPDPTPEVSPANSSSQFAPGFFD